MQYSSRHFAIIAVIDGDSWMTPTGDLWIVATPIGSLGDLAPRAAEVLADVDIILAEDTRRARRLLTAIEVPVRGRLRSLHEHNEQLLLERVVQQLRDGQSVALISDAGTPVLSDPGFLIVRAARREGLRVLSVPGASVYTAALAAAGQPPLPATLVGFLPPRGGPRRRRIADMAGNPWSLVVLLSPHRLQRELEDLAAGLGADRPATLLCELSKVHERALFSTLGELVGSGEAAEPRGEYVVVIGPETAPDAEAAPSREVVRAAYREALDDGHDRKEALGLTARRFGLRRRDVYQELID